ncbi:MAG: Gfo/Idh/MocA family oxidoreductase [Planctomycetes bacterium]|nr:Gfo/Idh/MocA family oxidoreductase [Planctomycetota bacterium]
MSAVKNNPFKTVLVGCGGMGRNQAKIIAGLDEFSLTAVCDVLPDNLAKMREMLPDVKTYTNYDKMLSDERPEAAAICTPNSMHAPQTVAAARAGVRGVYCEKPMAVNMGQARAMVEACRQAGAVLVVNHQRRIGPDLIEALRLIQAGAIGEVRLIRTDNAGDILSDGTHAVDSMLHLVGDVPAQWVLGQIHRLKPGEIPVVSPGKQAKPFDGFRYGHPVEAGGMAIIQIKDGPRVELSCGDMHAEFRAYQDYEIHGTLGCLWRIGDRHQPNLFISDSAGGAWQAGLEEWVYKPVPAADGKGRWRPVDLPQNQPGGIGGGYRLFAKSIREGCPHPMSGENALRGFEIVMAVYESARLNRKLFLPLEQDRFPLELMIEQGRLEK